MVSVAPQRGVHTLNTCPDMPLREEGAKEEGAVARNYQVFSTYKRYFPPVLSGICGENFSDEWKVVPVAPQRRDVHPDKSRGVLSDILVTASR